MFGDHRSKASVQFAPIVVRIDLKRLAIRHLNHDRQLNAPLVRVASLWCSNDGRQRHWSIALSREVQLIIEHGGLSFLALALLGTLVIIEE